MDELKERWSLKAVKVKGVCLVEHCDNPAPRFSNGKWCNLHAAEIRKAQQDGAVKKHRELVKKNKPITRYLAYAGVATRWTLEHPDEAFALVMRGESNYDTIGLAAAIVKAAGLPVDQIPEESKPIVDDPFLCAKCRAPRDARDLMRTSEGFVCTTVEICELRTQLNQLRATSASQGSKGPGAR